MSTSQHITQHQHINTWLQSRKQPSKQTVDAWMNGANHDGNNGMDDAKKQWVNEAVHDAIYQWNKKQPPRQQLQQQQQSKQSNNAMNDSIKKSMNE